MARIQYMKTGTSQKGYRPVGSLDLRESKGLKEFIFKNGEVWALNERNAIRKALAAGIKE